MQKWGKEMGNNLSSWNKWQHIRVCTVLSQGIQRNTVISCMHALNHAVRAFALRAVCGLLIHLVYSRTGCSPSWPAPLPVLVWGYYSFFSLSLFFRFLSLKPPKPRFMSRQAFFIPFLWYNESPRKAWTTRLKPKVINLNLITKSTAGSRFKNELQRFFHPAALLQLLQHQNSINANFVETCFVIRLKFWIVTNLGNWIWLHRDFYQIKRIWLQFFLPRQPNFSLC